MIAAPRTIGRSGALLALLLPAIAAAAGSSGLSPLPAQPPQTPWPTRAWPVGPLPAGVDPKAMEAALFVADGPRPGLGETRAVVVVQAGRLVAERYAPGFGPEVPLISWSMAKSVTQALAGIAVRERLIDLDAPMGNPRWAADDPRARVTWRQWLNMVDGQRWDEISVSDPTLNDSARMLFGPGCLDVAAYAAERPQIHDAGAHWNYNSGGINLVADALGRAFAPGAGPEVRRARVRAALEGELFAPLGMSSAQPQFDAAGTFIGSAFLYATARDFAKFGLLYLRDGIWDGQRLLPEGWVDFARTRTSAQDCDTYGAGWWIVPASGDGRPHRSLLAGLPKDAFAAQGHQGQLIVVVPSKDLVVVRLGITEVRGSRALRDWIAGLVALFPDQG